MRWIPILLSALLLLFPASGMAEIATTRDWIGLFPEGGGHTKNETLPTARAAPFSDGHAWVYTSSCTQNPGGTPKIADSGCDFRSVIPAPASGNFEYRLYANDSSGSESLIANSRTLTPGSISNPGPAVNITSCTGQSQNPRVIDGLISSPQLKNNFSNTGGSCVISNQATFAPFKIPSYEDLKSIYYTQAKESPVLKKLAHEGDIGEGALLRDLSGQDAANLIYINGNLSMNSNIGGAVTGVVFVEKNLVFAMPNFTYGNKDSGLVFVVKGDVIIGSGVRRIDAVIISEGKIYTAGADCQTNSVPAANPLEINGSLINLDSAEPIQFCRKISNNSPAEIIYQDPKYLVILRNLFADTLQKWSEVQ